jgi:hypothetical protein
LLAGVTGRSSPLAFPTIDLPGEADPKREAIMAEQLAPPSNGVPIVSVPASRRSRKQELARTLESKVAQGFRIESETETQAVLSMKGRRRWFGLVNGPEARYEVTIDESGDATSRRL